MGGPDGPRTQNYIYIKSFFPSASSNIFFLYIYIKESELVSGFFTEHSSIIFIFFFLAEYASIILISVLTTILFLGGYSYPFDWVVKQLNYPGSSFSPPHLFEVGWVLEGVLYGVSLGVKTCLIVFTFVWVRASLPRVRFDALMTFAWTVILPLIFAFIFLVLWILVSFDAVPTNFSGLFIPGLIAYNSEKSSSRGGWG